MPCQGLALLWPAKSRSCGMPPHFSPGNGHTKLKGHSRRFKPRRPKGGRASSRALSPQGLTVRERTERQGDHDAGASWRSSCPPAAQPCGRKARGDSPSLRQSGSKGMFGLPAVNLRSFWLPWFLNFPWFRTSLPGSASRNTAALPSESSAPRRPLSSTGNSPRSCRCNSRKRPDATCESW